MPKKKKRMPTLNYLRAFLRNNVSPIINENSLAEEQQQTAVFLCTCFDHVFEKLDVIEEKMEEKNVNG